MEETQSPQNEKAIEFARDAEAPAPSFMREMWDFLRTNKKWWLAPVVLMVLLVGILIIVGGSSAATFIYSLF